jgi:hypothetical protein
VPNLKAVLLGAIAAVALAMAVAGCATGSRAADLKLGDCFNRTPTVDSNGDSAIDNKVIDCAQPHDAEVFLVFEVPGASGPYPGNEAIGELQQTRCQAAFEGYVGKEYGLSSYTINYVRPDIDTWSSGDHQIACLIEDASAGKLTGSAKNTKK